MIRSAIIFLCFCVVSFGQGSFGIGIRNAATLSDMQAIIYPSNVTGLLTWVMADAGVYSDDGVTPCVDGNSIQRWIDQSGNGNDAKALNPAWKPVYRTGIINGLPVVDISVGANCSITNRTIGAKNPPLTLFAVFYPTNTGAAAGAVFYSQNPLLNVNANTIRVTVGSLVTYSALPWRWYQCTIASALGNENTIRFPQSRVYLFGSKKMVTAGNNLTYDFFRIGDYVDGPMPGYVAEIIFYGRRLQEWEMRGIELYLKRKYALQQPF